jgi:hypothetical protein
LELSTDVVVTHPLVSLLSPHRLMLAILFNIGPETPAVQHPRSRGWRESGNIRQYASMAAHGSPEYFLLARAMWHTTAVK